VSVGAVVVVVVVVVVVPALREQPAAKIANRALEAISAVGALDRSILIPR